MKRISKEEEHTEDEFRRLCIRQDLAIEDLMRFNISTILVDSYGDITKILARIERSYRQRTIFISGAAEIFDPWSRGAIRDFLRGLSQALVNRGDRISTGVGFGVGDAIISGALEQSEDDGRVRVDDVLILRPFPHAVASGAERVKLWDSYRREMIGHCGVAVFLLGNKRSDSDEIVLSDGVRREFELARELGVMVVPVGSLGYMARELWSEVDRSFSSFYPEASSTLHELFKKLGESVESPSQLIQPILNFLNALEKEG
jgi:hypothetical protein